MIKALLSTTFISVAGMVAACPDPSNPWCQALGIGTSPAQNSDFYGTQQNNPSGRIGDTGRYFYEDEKSPYYNSQGFQSPKDSKRPKCGNCKD